MPRPRTAQPAACCGALREGTHAQLPSVVLSAAISPLSVRLYAVLDRHADGAGRCFPAGNHLAIALGVSTDSVTRAVIELERCGALTVVRRIPKSNIYTLAARDPDSRTIAATDIGAAMEIAARSRPDSRTNAVEIAAPMRHEREQGTRTREESGARPDRCSRHATVVNPPPCHACRRAREAAEAAADEQESAAAALAETERRAQLCPHGKYGGAKTTGSGDDLSCVCAECEDARRRDAS